MKREGRGGHSGGPAARRVDTKFRLRAGSAAPDARDGGARAREKIILKLFF